LPKWDAQAPHLVYTSLRPAEIVSQIERIVT
jgi:hypothetical protein